MASTRYAVLIGNGTFPEEPGLADLRCPARDARGMAEVLGAPDRGAFADTHLLVDRPHHEIARTIQEVLHAASGEDLVLLYYSGHGKLNRRGKLHLAAADTNLRALESTSVPLTSVREFVDVSSCRRVVLVLDCCYSGAAGAAFVSKGDVQGELQIASGGRGTYIMTASTGTDVAHERPGDDHSVFTAHVLEGIRSGRADVDGDGWITVDELFDHVRREVARDTGQEPTKWGFDVRGDLVVARSGRAPRAPDATPGAEAPPRALAAPFAHAESAGASRASAELPPPAAGVAKSAAAAAAAGGAVGETREPHAAAGGGAGLDPVPWMRRMLLVQLAFAGAAIAAAAFTWAFLDVDGRVTRTEMMNGFALGAGPVGFLASLVLGLLGATQGCRPAVLQGWVYPWIAAGVFAAAGFAGAALGGEDATVTAAFLGVVAGCGTLGALGLRTLSRLPSKGDAT